MLFLLSMLCYAANQNTTDPCSKRLPMQCNAVLSLHDPKRHAESNNIQKKNKHLEIILSNPT